MDDGLRMAGSPQGETISIYENRKFSVDPAPEAFDVENFTGGVVY